MRKCFCVGCKTGYQSDVKERRKAGKEFESLFKPPKDKALLEKWRKAIGRKDRLLTEKASVCALHFKEDDLLTSFETVIYNGDISRIERERKRLKKDAVPSIFPSTPQRPRKTKISKNLQTGGGNEPLGETTVGKESGSNSSTTLSPKTQTKKTKRGRKRKKCSLDDISADVTLEREDGGTVAAKLSPKKKGGYRRKKFRVDAELSDGLLFGDEPHAYNEEDVDNLETTNELESNAEMQQFMNSASSSLSVIPGGIKLEETLSTYRNPIVLLSRISLEDVEMPKVVQLYDQITSVAEMPKIKTYSRLPKSSNAAESDDDVEIPSYTETSYDSDTIKEAETQKRPLSTASTIAAKTPNLLKKPKASPYTAKPVPIVSCNVTETLNVLRRPGQNVFNFEYLKATVQITLPWTVTKMNDFIALLRWNSIKPEKSIVIDKELNAKVFLEGIKTEVLENSAIDSFATLQKIVNRVEKVVMCKGEFKEESHCTGFLEPPCKGKRLCNNCKNLRTIGKRKCGFCKRKSALFIKREAKIRSAERKIYRLQKTIQKLKDKLKAEKASNRAYHKSMRTQSSTIPTDSDVTDFKEDSNDFVPSDTEMNIGSDIDDLVFGPSTSEIDVDSKENFSPPASPCDNDRIPSSMNSSDLARPKTGPYFVNLMTAVIKIPGLPDQELNSLLLATGQSTPMDNPGVHPEIIRLKRALNNEEPSSEEEEQYDS